MFQLNNRQVYKQLCQNKDCIQDYQTHHQHLDAKSDKSAGIALFLTELHFHQQQVSQFSSKVIDKTKISILFLISHRSA